MAADHMAKTTPAKKQSPANAKSTRQRVEKLEDQFQLAHYKLAKARENYLATHKNEVSIAREKMQQIQAKLGKARRKVARATAEARESGSRAASDQLKKAQETSLLLTDSLKEAKEIMVTAQSKLHAAKPFERKLAARAKVLAKFEKDWDKKTKEQVAKKAARAKKAAAKRRNTAKKRAAKKNAGTSDN